MAVEVTIDQSDYAFVTQVEPHPTSTAWARGQSRRLSARSRLESPRSGLPRTRDLARAGAPFLSVGHPC